MVDEVVPTPPPRRGIRLYSTSASAAEGQLTVLALVETVAASGLALWYAWSVGSATHLFVAALLTPFLLLRTPYSSEFTVELIQRAVASFDVPRLRHLMAGLLVVLIGPIVIASKVIGLAATLVRHPLETAASIPRNWFRVVAAQDTAHQPEVVPFIDQIPDVIPALKFYEWLGGFTEAWSERRTLQRIAFLAALCLIGLAIYLPALIYRFSVKSTAAVYLPFIWIARGSGRSTMTVAQWVELLRHDLLEIWRRWYAIATAVVLFVIPLWAFLFVHDAWVSFMRAVGTHEHDLVSAAGEIFVFVTPNAIDIKVWHLARLANVAITVWLWYYLRKTALRLSFGPIDERRTESLVSAALLARGMLGLFVIACTLVILGRAVPWEELPKVNVVWWPS